MKPIPLSPIPLILLSPFFISTIRGASPGFIDAERAWMDANIPGAILGYQAGLQSLEGILASDRPPGWSGEAELALRRLYRVRRETLSLGDGLPLFTRWMDPKVAGEANLGALARFYAGAAAERGGPGPEEARKLWEPLAFLARFTVLGPFDNERGGGFQVDLEPEKEHLEALRSGRLPLPVAGKSYSGKVRPVSWRKLPAPPASGAIDLDALFRPNDEALAYALTFVESPSDQPAALRLGSDEGCRAWLNGELVLSRDVRRRQAFDQDAAGIRLRKGWNSILLKITEGKGSWSFRARLTQPDGSPLDSVREGDPPSEASPGERAGGAGEIIPPSLGARDLLRKAIGGGEGAPAGDGSRGGREHYLLGAILLDVHGHDRGEHPDRELLRQAIAMEKGPAPAVYHFVLGMASKVDAESSAERDENDWREAMEAALASSPPSHRASLDLARYYLDSFGNFLRAQKLIDGVTEARPELPEALLLRARIEEGRGFPQAREMAIEVCARAFLESAGIPGVVDAEVARGLAESLRKSGRLDGAEDLLGRLLSRDRLDRALRRLLAEISLARGRSDQALELVGELRKFSPFDLEPFQERARIFESLERREEALREIEGALEIAPEDRELLRKKGLILRELGRKEEATRTFEKALSIQPNFPSLREYVEFLKKGQDEFSRRYRRDASKLVAQVLEEPAGGDDPVRVLLDLTAVRVNPDGTAKEFRQLLARAMNDRGTVTLSRSSTPYARGEQRVEFETARVYRKGGAFEDARLTVRGGDGDGEGGWASASVDLPPVGVGDVVEVQHVTEDLRQSFFGDYFGRRVVFRGDSPAAERTFILEAPSSRKLHFHQRNLDLAPRMDRDDASGTVVYTWTVRDVEAERPEPGMPPREEIDPLLEVSTFSSWDDFASWYWNLIRHQFERSPPMAAKAEELASGKSGEGRSEQGGAPSPGSPRDSAGTGEGRSEQGGAPSPGSPRDSAGTGEEGKIRAIYDFVTAEIRYNVWPFGVHGFKPYGAPAIFTRKFGDCKDKATLLVTMLGVLGIEAFPVLIRGTEARGAEDLSIPLVEHFNHCIAYVPPKGDRPGIFLDGTAEHNAMDELPSMDRGAKVLLVMGGKGTIAEVPWNRPEELGIEEEAQASLDPDGTARIQVRHRSRGDYAAWIRGFFEIPGKRREELEKIYGSRFAGAAIEEEKFSDLADRSRPAEFQVAIKVPAFIQKAPEGEILPSLDDLFETAGDFGRLGALEKRRHELILGSPRRSSLSLVYILPEGYRAKAVPEDRDLSGRFGRFTVQASRSSEGGREKITFRRILEVTSPRVSLADYGEFRELAAAVARFKDEKITIEKAR